MSSCTALDKLGLLFLPKFSVDTHGELVKDLLASWKPRCLELLLLLQSSSERRFTRRAFADVLWELGAITEVWLQTVEEPHPAGESKKDPRARHRLHIGIRDWNAKEGWWEDHLKSCFPTWLQLERLSWNFDTREYTLDSGY